MNEETEAERYEIVPNTYILDTSGTASEGEYMRLQADASYRRIQEWVKGKKMAISSEGK